MTSSRQRRWLVVFLTQDAVAPATEHLAGTTASAFERRASGFCAPLKPPWSREGGRAEERRMTLSRQPTAAAWASQRRRLGQRPPCPPASSAVTIVGLEPPPSSSIIAVAFSSLGCEATMRTPAGEECGAPALAPASPVKSEPASATAGREGTGSSLRSLQGGWMTPPPPLAANQRTLRRRQRRWRRRPSQHGGRWGGRSCHCCLAFLVAGLVAQQLGGWTNRCAKKPGQNCPSQTTTVK